MRTRARGLTIPRGIPFDNLARYWPMAEGSGTTAYDYTSNQGDGTINNGAWATTPYGTGIDFNGTSTYIPVSLPAMNDEFTICWWSTHDAPNDGDPDYVWSFRENNWIDFRSNGSNGVARMSMRDTVNGTVEVMTASEVVDSGRSFWTARYDGTTVELIKQSHSIATMTVDGTGGQGNVAEIGRAADTSDRYFDGAMNGMMVFDAHLSDELLTRIEAWQSRWIPDAYLPRSGGTMLGAVDFGGIPPEGVDTGGATPADTSTPVAWEEVTGEDGSTYYRPLYQ